MEKLVAVLCLMAIAGCSAPSESGSPAPTSPVASSAGDQIVAKLDILPSNVEQLRQTVGKWEREEVTVEQAAKLVEAQVTAMTAASSKIGTIDPAPAWVPAYNAMGAAWSKWDEVFDGYLARFTGHSQFTPTAATWLEAQEKFDEAAFKANAQLASPHFTKPMTKLSQCSDFRGTANFCMHVAIRNLSNATARIGVAEHNTMGNNLDPGLEASLAANQTKPSAGRIDSCYGATTELYAYRSDGASITYDYTPDAKFPVDCKNLAPDSMVVVTLGADGMLRSSVETRPCVFFGSYQECPIA